MTARRVLDCRGYPTVQVDVWVGDVLGPADVPAGRSTGRHKAVELRDCGQDEWVVAGMQSATALLIVDR